MTATSKPVTMAEIHARYEEIAPGATSDTPEPALALARWLTFAAQRGFTRMISPHVPLDHGEMLLLIARFEALHMLSAAIRADSAEADQLAREVLNAVEDGGAIGGWLYGHGQLIGVDAEEISRLADAEAALEAEQARQAERP